MKRLILALVLFLGLSSLCFAGVTGQVLDVIQDQNTGSIIVRTQYILDGVEVVSRYPVDAQGRYYWQTRYNINQFAGMTDLEVKTYILKDLANFMKQLITQTYYQKANFEFTQAKASKLIGANGTVTSAEVLVDTNADGVVDTKWVVHSDGTRTEEAYVTP